jgi:SAM-dependent methyltransferase
MTWLGRFRKSTITPGIPRAHELAAANIGGGDFGVVGQEFLESFKSLAGLEPSAEVLDIGCGIGRMAIPLTTWLSPQGRYEGCDVVPSSIRWCQQNISSRHRNFSFRHMDVKNGLYNPSGSVPAEDYTFPFASSSFDVVIAVSLFTHLLPPATSQYLKEIHRVLRPGGRLFATWFLWDPDCNQSREALAMFPFDRGDHRVGSETQPEAVVAYPRAETLAAHKLMSLEPGDPVRGNWVQGKHEKPYQDTIVAVRAGTDRQPYD